MNLLDNWLFQTLVGNFIFFILGKICMYLYNSFKNQPSPTNTTTYSAKTLRIQFYVCMIIDLISLILIFNVNLEFLKVFLATIIFWATLFLIFAFECSVEQINSNRA